MNILESFLMGRGGVALGLTLFHSLWQGALIAVILGLVLRGMRDRGAEVRYLLCLGALGLMLAVPAATFVYLYEGLPQVVVSRQPGAATPGVTLVTLTLPAAAAASLFPPLLRWVTALWLAGVGVFSARLMSSWLFAQHLRYDGTFAAPEPWSQVLQDLAEELGVTRTVTLLESQIVDGPMTIGWLKPVILLPSSALMGLSPRQLEAVLAHELAHIRRNDYVINLIQSVIETLLFFHPAVWWVGRVLRDEREHCCDDAAVSVCGDVLTYARALTRLESLRIPEPRLAMGATGGSLLGRVRRLLKKPLRETGPGRWVAGAFAFGAAMTVVAGAEAAWAPPAEAEAKATPEAQDADAESQPYQRTVSVAAGLTQAEAPESRSTQRTPRAPRAETSPSPASLGDRALAPRAPLPVREAMEMPRALAPAPRVERVASLEGRQGLRIHTTPAAAPPAPGVPAVAVTPPTAPTMLTAVSNAPAVEVRLALGEGDDARVDVQGDASDAAVLQAITETLAAVETTGDLAAGLAKAKKGLMALDPNLYAEMVAALGQSHRDVDVDVDLEEGEDTRVAFNDAYREAVEDLNEELREELESLQEARVELEEELREEHEDLMERYHEELGELRETFEEEVQSLQEGYQELQERAGEWYAEAGEAEAEGDVQRAREIRRELSRELSSGQSEFTREVAHSEARFKAEIARLNSELERLQAKIERARAQQYGRIDQRQAQVEAAYQRELASLGREHQAHAHKVHVHQDHATHVAPEAGCGADPAWQTAPDAGIAAEVEAAQLGARISAEIEAGISEEIQREMERAQREIERAQREVEQSQRELERGQREAERAQRQLERVQTDEMAGVTVGPDGAMHWSYVSPGEAGQFGMVQEGGPVVLLPPGAFAVREGDQVIEIEGLGGALKLRIEVEGGVASVAPIPPLPAVPAVPAVPAPPAELAPPPAPPIAPAPEIARVEAGDDAADAVLGSLDRGITGMKADLDRFEAEVRSVVAIEIQRIFTEEIPKLDVVWVGGTEARREAALQRLGQRLGQSLRLRIEDDEVRVLSTQPEILEWLMTAFAGEESLLNTTDRVDPEVQAFLERLSEGLSQMVISAESEDRVEYE